MEVKRTQNTKRSIVFGLLNKIITLILPFLVRTVMIRVLGAEFLGLNSLFGSILQVLNLSELGFSNAIVYSMYKPIAENDSQTICSMLKFYRKIYRMVGVFVLGAGCVLLPFLPLFVKGEIPEAINLNLVYLIYLGTTSSSYLFFAYKACIPSAFQRNDIISNIGTVTQGGMYFLQIIILLTVKNYYLYIVLMPIFTLLNNFLLSLWVEKVYPEFKCEGSLKKEVVNDIKVKVSGLMINKVCQTTRNALDSICVSAFLGLTITAMYNNYYYIINALISISIVVTSSMAAGVGNSIVLETKEKNYNDMCRINFLFMWIAGWCTICLLCLYQPFMKIWVGNNLMFDMGVVILFSVYFYALKMGDIRGLYSDAAGLWWENRYRAIIESVSNIMLNIVLAKFWGIYGIISATLISLLVINFGIGSHIVFKYYFKNGKVLEYFLQHGKYLGITILNSIITYVLCQTVKLSLNWELVGDGLICLIIPNLVYFIIYRRSKQYKETVPWILNKIRLAK